MNKKIRLNGFFAFLLFAVFCLPSIAAALDDTWLELSFTPPAGWKQTPPDKLNFSLLEFEPAYVYQKGDAVIFVLYQQAEGLSLQNATQWMRESASEVGKTSDVDYVRVNGRIVSRFVVRGKGKDIGSIPSLAGKQIDNEIVTAINGEWLLRVIYSSPDYQSNLAAFEAFIGSIFFKGAEDPNDAAISSAGSSSSGGISSEKVCETDSSIKLLLPKDGSKTANSEANLKIQFKNIEQIIISVNGEETAVLADPESPAYRNVALEKGDNTIKILGVDKCGRASSEVVKVIREEK